MGADCNYGIKQITPVWSELRVALFRESFLHEHDNGGTTGTCTDTKAPAGVSQEGSPLLPCPIEYAARNNGQLDRSATQLNAKEIVCSLSKQQTVAITRRSLRLRSLPVVSEHCGCTKLRALVCQQLIAFVALSKAIEFSDGATGVGDVY